MAENNLTTTARAVTRMGLGVKIIDPTDNTKVITRKPENGILDLSDLSNSSGGSSTEIEVGQQLEARVTSLNDYMATKQLGERIVLNGVKEDVSNLPNGISISFVDVPIPINVKGSLCPCEVTQSKILSHADEDTLKPSESGFETLSTSGVKFSKAQILQALEDSVTYVLKPSSSNFGTYMAITPDSPDTAPEIIKNARLDFGFEIVNSRIQMEIFFQINVGTPSDGKAYIPVDKIVAY